MIRKRETGRKRRTATFTSRTATILAATALVVAVLGSTPLGHAAGSLILARNSVGTAQLKRSAVTAAKLNKNAVTATKLGKNAVTGVKVKNGTLLAADFKPGQLPAGPAGLPGPQGPKGDPGPQGPQGQAGSALGYARVSADASVFENYSLNVSGANVTKPAGTYGVYCFDGLPFTPKSAVVTLGALVGLGTGATSPTPKVALPAINPCPTGADVRVRLADPDTGQSLRDHDFFVLFN